MVLRQKKRFLPDLVVHRSRDLLGQLVKHNFQLGGDRDEYSKSRKLKYFNVQHLSSHVKSLADPSVRRSIDHHVRLSRSTTVVGYYHIQLFPLFATLKNRTASQAFDTVARLLHVLVHKSENLFLGNFVFLSPRARLADLQQRRKFRSN